MIERESHYAYGPRFFRGDNGAEMFEHRIDSRSCIGPRVATKIDKQNHPGLWADYLARQTEELDRELSEPKRRKAR